MGVIPPDPPLDPVAEQLRSLGDLRRHEGRVLELVRSRRFGPQLFLVDPVRFLREAGWSVSDTLEAELVARRPEGPAVGRYERVEEGIDGLCGIEIKFSGLGIPEELE